ncbi:hypothetical protein [Parasitella parasitica]|uniref:Kinesin-like protein unc-104 n=1 Tax=Parasitella parasitica TaxID=35722 RepID=A0A0B7N7Q3_9FUNG|nr:hypothetical protein [Parasitella parasitica]
MSGSNIKVVVRCRPLNAREKARGAPCLIRMEGNKTIISKPPGSAEDPKAFTFDQSYWSADKDDDSYADQERVYNDLGRELLDHAFNGYNCCLFAYGQTGSGKSYSMMGYGEDKGIIPRTCSELFDRISATKTEVLDFQVEVSYIEIYNEKVRDLLNPQNKSNLKVREHPVLGPYVQDLSRLAVNSFENIDQLMDEGNKARTVAATNMNETSSRSHAVFTIFVTQKILDPVTKQTTDKVARISLVDLAGSERANSTGATGVRLKEGANINKSLTTLGKVIAGLAEQASAESSSKKSKKPKEAFVPFRDSVLTWLLKDSLGGNSKTCMIAAISPADYDETISTLRYADQAKKIKTKAVVNEDPNAKIVRELKDEVDALRQALMVYAPEEVEKIQAIAHPTKKRLSNNNNNNNNNHAISTARPKLLSPTLPVNSKSTVVFTDASGNTTQLTKEEMIDKLQMTEKLLGEMNQTWEEKLQNTEKIHIEREKLLKHLGITIEKNNVGLYTPKEEPYLINLNEDPLMSECLMYNIKPGITHVDQGLVEDEVEERTDGSGSIRLSGSNIHKNHCYFDNTDDIVTLYPRLDCTTMVNGMRISEPKRLRSGYRIILGDHHVFRFNNPGEALKEREQQQLQLQPTNRADSPCGPPSPTTSGDGVLPPPLNEVMDWNFARREAMLNSYINDSNFENFTNEDLDKLFDDVAKVRVIRKRQSTCSSSSSALRSNYSTTTSSVFLDDDNTSYTTDTTSSCSLLEQDMELHRKKYEAKLHRLNSRISNSHQQPIEFTPKERIIAQKVANHWRRQRNVTMAQAMLVHDIYLRQANNLASKADKNVFYQYAIVHDDASAQAMSHNDADLLKAAKPCMAVQVVDREHGSVYVWSLEKFMARLRYLTGASYSDDSKKYLKGEDMFYDTSEFTLVGLAKVSLRNLATQVPVQSLLSVHSRSTGSLMGHLKVLVSPIARSVRHHQQQQQDSPIEDENPRRLLHVGQQLVFEIVILELIGLSPQQFSRVHAQFRLSTFGSHLDGVFAADTVNVTDTPAQFNYHQTLSMAITEEMLQIIETQDITFEVFGKPCQGYLQKLIVDQETAEHNMLSLPSKPSQDVVAHIQICELTPEGDYNPVPVEPAGEVFGQYDTFSLQQGQQRRVVLSLSSTGAFEKIVDLRIGHVRLVDSKYRTVESPNASHVNIPLNVVSSTHDGNKSDIHGAWDSSLHDTRLLNGVTSNTHKVALTLSWAVRCPDCTVRFEKDIFVHIKDQQKAVSIKKKIHRKRSSLILNFFTKSSPTKKQITSFYTVNYKADLSGGQDLQYLPSPAHVLCHQSRQEMQRRERVDALRHTLFLKEQLDRLCGSSTSPKSDPLTTLDIITLWSKESMCDSNQIPPQDKLVKPTVSRWIPQTHQILIPLTEQHTKKGFLMRKNASENAEVWDKYWCVLTRHFLFLYPDQSEASEIDILKIKSVHRDNKVLDATKPKSLFTIDTLYDSHTFQALDKPAMDEWLAMME